MKPRALAILMFFVMVLTLSAAALPKVPTNRPAYASDLIKVKLSPDAVQRAALPQGLYAESNSFGVNELDQLMSVNGGTKVIRAHRRLKDTAWEARTGFDRWFLIKLDGRASVDQALASFRANRYVEDATYEYYAYPSAVPNDPQYSTHWGHNNTAQFPSWNSSTYQFTGPAVGIAGFDVDAQLAWDLPQGYGSADIVVAIIDSGVDTSHPDLRQVTGYDFGDNDTNPMDDATDAGHGTLCAGVTAAIANNNLGVVGIAGGCSIMPLKVADSDGNMAFTSIANAITYAVDHDADVISMSLGANITSDSTVDPTLTYANNNGVVVLAATGNYYDPAYISGNQIQDVVSYPAVNQYVISVGAASPGAERKSYTSVDNVVYWGSCYGTNVQDDRLSVDIMAPSLLPSTDIQSTAGWNHSSGTAGNYYSYFGGTSCATPYAAGVAALLLSYDPTLTPAEIRNALVTTATDMTIDGGVGWDRYTGYGMINAYQALLTLSPGQPTCQITAPTGGSVHDLNSSIQINVSATDSDGTISNVKFYVDDVLKNTDSSTPYSWTWDTPGYSGGSHTIKAVATDNDLNTRESTVTITLLAPPDEGFESGNFGAFSWNNSSAVAWTVQSSEKYSGSYAAKAGPIGNSASTTLSITLNVTTAGDLSYFYKVSSESGYDYLRFYLDDVQQAQWSGEAGWALQTHAISTGLHSFKWTYSKDVSYLGGSDTAWLDHIIFPEFGAYYPPPRNLAAVGGNGFVNLSWQAPDGGTPTSYKIFKNGSELSTTSNLYYTDNAVINGNTYSYYLTAVYSGGESDPTATVNATPNVVSSVTIGSGTSSTATSAACPINVYYQSLHGQSVYTKAELNTAGATGPIQITQIGFNVTGLPTKVMPNFVVRMKHTTATNVASWIDNSNLVTVYSNATYQPTTTGWNMLTLTNPFTWNGSDNILVDTAFGLIGSWDQSGVVQYTTVTSGYRYTRSDTVDQTNVFSGSGTNNTTSTYRPNIKLTLSGSITPVPFAQGFESGLGNWLFANGSQTNKWARSTATANTGDTSLYISNNGGTSNAYTTSSASIVHAYSAVSFPSGSESWKLRFNWKAQGESSTDYLKVYLVDATTTPVAGTLLSSGQLGGTYNLSSAWQEVTLDIPAGVNGQTRLLVFSWANNSSGGTNPPAAIDDIRIVPGSQSDAAVVIDNSVTVDPPAVTDPESNVINTSVEITGITETEGYVLVITGYDSIGAPYDDAGLDFVITGVDLAGSTITFAHGLGFVPTTLAYKVGDSGAWNIVTNPGGWTDASAWFTVPAAKAEGDIYAAFPKNGDDTLPVELSSFTATLNAYNKVLLTWVTQSEDNCMGYHIFRNSSDALDSAIDLQTLVEATNTSQQQVYIFEDAELQEDGTWYYWLQSLDMDGSHAFFGPISIAYSNGGGNNSPGVPLVTELLSAYPNPFNPSTTIRYALAEPGKVEIVIFNTRGQKVREFSIEHSQPGFFKLIWDGKDSYGNMAASGLYFYRMNTARFHQLRKMVLAK
ncbi:MAG TPA: S8 family serine peptidase [Candidatus Cloacimonadota bacterium]|nr:S8 family serine peptidase [Candidatus Cloacimonadota bacterium]